MAKDNDKKTIKEKIQKGAVLGRLIVEILGKPKEHVQKVLEKTVDLLKEHKGVEVIKKEIAEPKEHENYFTAFAEVEILAKDLYTFTGVCYDLLPSSVEILEPEELTFSNRDISAMMNDMALKLQQFTQEKNDHYAKLALLSKSFNGLLANLVLFLVHGKPKPIDYLSKCTGVQPDELKNFLEKLIKEERIEFKDNLYGIKN